MNQPDLGLKVAELRQQKGLTQERLAELCEVSPRTIQRIESGEVDPRLYTLHCLGEALDFDFGEQPAGNENLWLAVLHLSSILCLPVIPLLLWSWQKGRSYKLDQQGRQVLNFQITMTLCLFGGAFLLIAFPAALALAGAQAGQQFPVILLATVCLPAPLLATGLFCTFEGIVNAVRSLSERPIRYALTIPFVK